MKSVLGGYQIKFLSFFFCLFFGFCKKEHKNSFGVYFCFRKPHFNDIVWPSGISFKTFCKRKHGIATRIKSVFYREWIYCSNIAKKFFSYFYRSEKWHQSRCRPES